eukprot:TRINITY_DN21489_c0_g1_i2.p3 TRINITY_DN21489_c0_g1~~TRINITY_DN21489_c0_g1_i2.p3  ORF type:complete len:101 (+),score=33.16 TRINITY_DN21489_c0_g1_i2:110-412(+)
MELGAAARKKPPLQQQLTIYRKRFEIAEFAKTESLEAKAGYKHLTDMIKFEELLSNCKMAIERVVNLQVEFWAQVANQLPDLNVMPVSYTHLTLPTTPYV